MKKTIKQQRILFWSLLKWVFISIGIGFVVGISVGLFLTLLKTTVKIYTYDNLYLLLPFVLLITNFLIKRFSDEKESHGTDKIIDALHKKSGKINIIKLPIDILTTVLTISFGGSAGKESPSAQLGGTISSFIGQLFKLKNDDLKKIVICGIGSGFSAVFGTPIAGAIFGIEVLFVGKLLYDVLLPSFVSSVVTVMVVNLFFNIENLTNIIITFPKFSFYSLFISIVCGIFFGLISYLFIEIFNIFKKLSLKIKGFYLYSLIVGTILVIIYRFVSKDLGGIGMDVVKNSLNGKEYPFYYPILKILTTSLTLNFGGDGGLINPIFFIGSTSGNLLSTIFPKFNIQFFSILGLVSLLAGTTNTPLASSLLALEIAGPSIAPYASISCLVSFLITGHKSIYSSQVLAMKKVEEIEGKIGEQIKGI